jgi:A/G-specific adenine glycosylase
MKFSATKIKDFQEVVLGYYKKHARTRLAWRKNTSDYYVVVSEIMLQQTQVDRVIPFFNNWIEQFPNWQALASASQVSVLRHWKGLGYNSRALRLHKLAKIIVSEYSSQLPADLQILEKLPGIGPYTAGAIMAFVYNKPVVMIETNIRRVFLYHFFQGIDSVHDRDILELLQQSLPAKNIRQWYWALMDYGSYLGRELKINGKKFNPNIISRHYTKQSKFTGSDRQIRGKILEILLSEKTHTITFTMLYKKLLDLTDSRDRIDSILQDLIQEGFIGIKGGRIVLKR